MNQRRLVSGMLIALAAAAACEQKKPPVQVITTHEVAATGIAQRMLDAFARQGSGSAMLTEVATKDFLATVNRTHPDVAIVNDEQLVEALTKARLIRLSNTIRKQRFVIAGPARDPARVHAAGSAVDAFRRVYESHRPFCSPVDVPHLRQREAMLWSSAAVDPHDGSRYRECKGAASEVLKEAVHRQAYTLTDRDTFEQEKPRGMKILFENTPVLNDDFVMALLRTPRPNRDAEWLVEWSMSARAREVIDSYEAKPQ